MSTPEKKSRGGGRVAFLKHREAIRELIEAGHVRRKIYDDLGGEEELGISYSQFMRYVNQFILPRKSHDVQTTPPSQSPSGVRTGGTPPAPAGYSSSGQSASTTKPASSTARPGAQPRIQHSSVAADKDELV